MEAEAERGGESGKIRLVIQRNKTTNIKEEEEGLLQKKWVAKNHHHHNKIRAPQQEKYPRVTRGEKNRIERGEGGGKQASRDFFHPSGVINPAQTT